MLVIDLFGLTSDQVRVAYPEVYQHLLSTVKSARQLQYKKSPTRDSKEYLDRWWTFSKPREELRPALVGLKRYVGTARTAKHRVFSFIPGNKLPESEVVAIASDDGFHLAVLSSRIHIVWVQSNKGTLEDRPRYLKSSCFDPFPFPDCVDVLKEQIRAVAEELDTHRKARQAEHPRLTLTQIYNVLQKLTAGENLDVDDERIKSEGLILILKELHENLDALVFEAYGWPATLADEDILRKLVALNKERADEEREGHVRWLRPDYQVPRFGSEAERARLEEERRRADAADMAGANQGALALEDDLQEMKARFPTGDELAETAAVMRVLAGATEALTSEQIARTFAQGKAVERRVALTLRALARLGHLASADGGQSFVLRGAA